MFSLHSIQPSNDNITMLHIKLCLSIILRGLFCSPFDSQRILGKEKKKCHLRQRKQDSSEDIGNESLFLRLPRFSKQDVHIHTTPIIMILAIITVWQRPPPLKASYSYFCLVVAAITQQGFNDFLPKEELVLRFSLCWRQPVLLVNTIRCKISAT